MRNPIASRCLMFVTAVTVFATASCTPDLPGSEALGALEAGAPRAEVLSVLPPGGIIASRVGDEALLANGYWRDQYFIEGRVVEVLWVHDPTRGFPAEDWRTRLNPVIFVDERLDGWGWRYFDRRREEWGIREGPSNVPEMLTV